MFVPGALPGETARVRIVRLRRGYAEGVLVETIVASPERRRPPCPFFDRCGGCDLQHLSEAGQAEAKRGQVIEALRRIGTLGAVEVEPTRRAGPPLGYRFRMDFDWRQQDGRGVLGLHRRDVAQEIVAVDPCLLAGPATAEIVRFLPAAAARAGLAAYDERRGRGLLRRLTVQEARGTREVLVTLETGRGDPPALAALAADLVRRIPRVVGVVRHERDREGGFVGASILAGRDHLEEVLDGDRFRVPAAAFFQPNPEGSLAVRRAALDAVAVVPGMRLLELYAGAGFFSVAAARRGAVVTLVEADRDATEAARENLRRGGASSFQVVRADVTRALQDLAREEWDAVLLDPPRTGLAPEGSRLLAGIAAPRLVYVSCDAGTLSRDLGTLVRTGGWEIEKVIPFDLFPQTQHVECVAALRRRPG